LTTALTHDDPDHDDRDHDDQRAKRRPNKPGSAGHRA